MQKYKNYIIFEIRKYKNMLHFENNLAAFSCNNKRYTYCQKIYPTFNSVLILIGIT